jgi:hypothetical protein
VSHGVGLTRESDGEKTLSSTDGGCRGGGGLARPWSDKGVSREEENQCGAPTASLCLSKEKMEGE